MSTHNPEVVGSSPASATRITPEITWFQGFYYVKSQIFSLPYPLSNSFLTHCFLSIFNKFWFCLYFTELHVIRGRNSFVFRSSFTNFAAFWGDLNFNRFFNNLLTNDFRRLCVLCLCPIEIVHMRLLTIYFGINTTSPIWPIPDFPKERKIWICLIHLPLSLLFPHFTIK